MQSGSEPHLIDKGMTISTVLRRSNAVPICWERPRRENAVVGFPHAAMSDAYTDWMEVLARVEAAHSTHH